MSSSLQKGKENKFYITVIFTTIVLFVVFFTSKLWMYDDNPNMQTPFNTDILGLDQTTLKLNRWEYNPEKKLMEVSIETIHTGTDVVKPTFTFEAKERDSLEEYPVKVVYEDDTNIVVQIENVPETYRIIGLFVYEHRDRKILENEARERYSLEGDTLNPEETETELELPKPSEKILVGDYRSIKINTELETKDVIEYQIENVKREIKEVENQIKIIIEEKIPLQEELIVALEEEIETIKNDLEYQTKEEKEESESEIKSKNEAIGEAKKEINELKENINKLMEKREKLQEKLNSISPEMDKKDKDKKKEKEKTSDKNQDKKDKSKSKDKPESDKETSKDNKKE